jgi:membrane protease YdiL (CAAX protease family)
VLGEYLRLRIPDYREIVLSVVAVFALQQLLQGYMVLQDSLPLPPELRRMVDQFEHLFEEAYKQLIVARSPVEFVYVVIVVALVPAVCEELLFRGLVQRSFEAATDGLSAAIVTGVIFGAYHLNPFAFVPLAALGAYFGFIVYRSQNITVAISAHFFNNFVACAAVYMRLDEEFIALAPAGDVTPEVLFFNYVLFGVVFVVSTYYFMRVTEPPAHAHP